MIKQEYPYIRQNGTLDDKRIRFYSDDGKQLINLITKEIYDEAIDVYPTNNVYEEIEPIVEVEVDDIEDDENKENETNETAN